jgi:hypothetical protein
MIVWVDASSRGLFVPEALTHEARGARFAPKIEHRGGEGVPSQLWIMRRGFWPRGRVPRYLRPGRHRGAGSTPPR